MLLRKIVPKLYELNYLTDTYLLPNNNVEHFPTSVQQIYKKYMFKMQPSLQTDVLQKNMLSMQLTNKPLFLHIHSRSAPAMHHYTAAAASLK